MAKKKEEREERKLRKIQEHGWIGGVCSGIAYWMMIPTWLVRFIVTITVLWYGVGILPYILLWIFLPSWEEDPEDYEKISE